MLFCLVRPVKRKGTLNHQFVQRIPADVKGRAAGLTLPIPVGDETVIVKLSPKAASVRLSLRSSHPSTVKQRHAQVAAHLETVWQGFRLSQPEVLSHRQIVALSRQAYEGWGSLAEFAPQFSEAESAWEGASGDGGVYANAMARLIEGTDPLGRSAEQQAAALGERILARHGKLNVAQASKELLAVEILRALKDGFELGDRQTAGDYSPDPKANRFPAWESPVATAKPTAKPTAAVSLKGLVEDWWKEAKKAGRAISTYESYRAIVGRLADFLKHDDATRVTPTNVVAYKDHRLAKGVSAKTVGDSDISGLRSIFAWAVNNQKITTNPAEGIKVTRAKATRTRSKALTMEEAKAVLAHALHAQRGQANPKTHAAKRWVPWLCAYTGARVGEMVQLRKEDFRQAGKNWILTITPEAGTVKDKEARELVLHAHLVETGLLDFVRGSAPGYLFLTQRKDGERRGVWRSTKNRITAFVREVVTDTRVAPNHGWRHLFKTVGREAGIEDSVLDGICGHAAKSVGGSYGEVSLKAQIAAMRKFPRFKLGVP